MKKLVIIPGGFHPYHAGHKALYDAAREAFPSAEVYVAATDDTTGRPFPFKTKKFLAQQAGIPGNRFIQVKSPFSAEEITQHFDPNETQLIFVRSEKDRDQRPQPGQPGQIITRGPRKGLAPYLQPYRRNGLEPMKDHAYMTYLPTVQFGPGMTSATEIRAKWPGMDEKQKSALVQVLYPLTAGNDAKVAKIVEILDTVMATNIEEGLGKALATAALTGSMFAGQPADAQTIPDGNTRATVVINGQQKVFDMGKMDVRKAAEMLEKSLDSKGITNFKATITDGRHRMNIDATGAVVDRTNEAVLINDPDAGHQIRPDGGMGTWDESSLVSNLARKFAAMVEMVKNKNYTGLEYVLYQGGAIKNMVSALAQYEKFMQKQGRRPMARGKEIDMGQSNLAEKVRMRMPVDEAPDYIDEGDVVPFPPSATPPDGYEQAKQLAFKIVNIAKDEKIQDPGPLLAPLRRDLQMLGWRVRMDQGGLRLIHTRSNWNTIIDPMK